MKEIHSLLCCTAAIYFTSNTTDNEQLQSSANIFPIQFRSVQPVPGLPILSVQTLKEKRSDAVLTFSLC